MVAINTEREGNMLEGYKSLMISPGYYPNFTGMVDTLYNWIPRSFLTDIEDSFFALYVIAETFRATTSFGIA